MGKLTLLALACACAVAPAWAQTAAVPERVAAGEVLVGQRPVAGFSIPAVSLDFAVDAPAEKVWAVIDDCKGYVKSMPRVIAARETLREGGRTVCTWTVGMPFPFKDIDTTVEARNKIGDGKWTRDFRQTAGDFLKNEGQWSVMRFADGKRTWVHYDLHAVMNSAVPDALVKRGQMQAMRDIAKNIRDLSR